MNAFERSSSGVVVPYYLSQGYNYHVLHLHHFYVVVPYYLSQGYNGLPASPLPVLVVVPYYLSQGYNPRTPVPSVWIVVVPYYLSQGYNAYPKRPQNHSLCGLFKCQKTNKKKNRNAYGIPVFLHNIVSVSSPYFVSMSASFSPQSTSIMANCRSVITKTRTDPVCGRF